MVDSGRSLVLGFMGDESVHLDNARALLEDLITTYLRNNKGAQVKFILATEPFTDTMADLADYCLTSGYSLGLIGHADSLGVPEVAPFLSDAEGNLITLKSETSIAKGMAATLGIWANTPTASSRLILISDPDGDDTAYTALVASIEKNIPVRSLLKGLDIIELETDEEETILMPVNDDELEEEEFPENDGLDDDEIGDPDPEDFDPVEGEDEEDEDEEPVIDPEEDDDEAEDLEPEDAEEEGEIGDEDGDEGEPEPEEDDLDDGVEDFDEESDQPDDEIPPDEEENEEAKMPATTKPSSAPRPWTAARLVRFAERDREGFLKLAKKYKFEGEPIRPGRGIKNSTMATRIMEAMNGKAPTAPAPKRATTTSPKRKTSTKAPTGAKRGPGRPRKTDTTTTAPAKRRGRPPSTAATNGHVPRADAKKLMELAEQAIKVAKTLV